MRSYPSDPAAAAVVAALDSDPFYVTITAAYQHAPEQRRAVLAAYFAYSIAEGVEVGRCVRLQDQAAGVAVWLLPQSRRRQTEVRHRKAEFLQSTLGERGYRSYQQIVDYMKQKADPIVRGDAWYLSIVGVDPRSQGRGFGQQLLAPTLSEADQAGAMCYLETFAIRNVSFYERLGFVARGLIPEPTTGAEYTLLIRNPK